MTQGDGKTAEEEEDEEDHHKFFKKMQECFSSTNNILEQKEREEKTQAYSLEVCEVKEELRHSLSDKEDSKPHKRRDRSTSNETFNLPPLSSFADNKDLEGDDEMVKNYKSNEFGGLDLDIDDVAIDLEDGEEEDKRPKKEVPPPAFDFFAKALMADDQEQKIEAKDDDEALIVFDKLQKEVPPPQNFDDIKNIFDQID